MQRFVSSFLICFAAAIFVFPTATAEDVEFFEARIRPILVKHCYECHSSGSSEVKGGLLLDFRKGIRNGGETGPAIVPGKPDESLLLDALRYESFEMPPAGQLPKTVIADFDQWIRTGAADPRDNAPSPAETAAQVWQEQLAERSHWWSLQPLNVVAPSDPADVTNDAWSQEPVDRFVHAALQQAAIPAATPADALTLLRRVSFVLTGLPPTPEQTRHFPPAFAADADVALAALVEELLDSPHFGERFARHWMDVVRYTDTYGYEWDNPAKGSWEYRDYLIRAFNDDVGFDQLIREQIAGDLLEEPRINKAAGVNESLIAPMFYHMGEHRHGNSLDFNGIHQEMINNKVDAFSKAFLAMTVACARCHDHKLDAISQADYYALAGVFMSPRWTSRVIDAPGKHDAEISELKTLRDEIRSELAAKWTSSTELSNSDSLTGAALHQWAKDNSAVFEKLTIEDVGYPMGRLVAATETTIADIWTSSADEWRAAHEARCTANATKFTVATNFDRPGFPDGWTSEGDGINHGYVADGTPLISLEGGTLITELLPHGYHTHALSSKLPGAVRLPSQEALPGNHVSLKLRGSEWSGFLVVPQNAFHSESVTFLEPNNRARRWLSIADSGLKNGVTRVFTEVATSSLNPNFPPRTGVARAGSVRLPDDDEGLQKRSWFSLTGIVTHDAGGTPQDTLAAFASLYDQGEAPAKLDEAWHRIADWFEGALNRWAQQTASADDVVMINWLLSQKRLPNQEKQWPAIDSLVQRYRAVEARIAFPRSANSMDEREVAPFDYRLNVRGNVDEDGPAIPRNFLNVFDGKHGVAGSHGSGRRELAEYLSSRDNPQTARVYVNRVWQWIFGRGIVGTPSDFGKLGDRPSHPELLDWLADRFMSEGWSTKQLVRRLVLSQAFRQSSLVAQNAADRDPDNRLLHHYPTRRLEAEAIRDSLLFVSGRLDARLYGPPINPPRAVDDPAKRLFSGPLDSNGRRSIYMKMSIMDPPKFLVCFNLPDLKLPTGQRDVTNVPAQALALLNDPLVVKLAEHWAERLIQDDSSTAEQRVSRMFTTALGRTANDSELQRWTSAVAGISQADDLMKDTTAWAELAHALFNTKEFLYYR